MRNLKYITNLFREFSKRWGSYLLLIGLVTAFVRVLIIPVIRFLATTIIGFGKIPYLSLDNWLQVFTGHPFVGIGLSLLGLIILALVYLQFSILLVGINNIHQRKTDSFKELIIASFASFKKLNFGSFLAFIVYFVLLLPLIGNYFGTDLLSKFRVPVFIIDTIVQNPLVDIIVLVSFIILFYIGIRLIFVLSETVLKGNGFITAIKNSWFKTKHNFWKLTVRVFILGLISAALVYGWANLLYIIQEKLDGVQSIALTGAVINMLLLIFGNLIFQGILTGIYFLFISSPINFEVGQTSTHPKRKIKFIYRLGAGVMFLGFLAIIVAYNFTFMFGGFDYQPLMISHRGVDGPNGVQNTIAVLKKTAKEHPDYVEMDIHETKDQQFVVMHDADLVALADINKKVHDLTLAELKQIKIHENGFTTTISGFDDYLNEADKLKQKLIVEIKTTPQDTLQMMNNFMNKYAARLQREKHRVHSLTYDVVKQLHQKYPKLYTSLILPYTLVYPRTNLQGYTLEETTIDTTTMNQALNDKQQIWAWTVDEPDDMAQMMSLGVNGIITNNLSELKAVVKEQNDHPSYAQRLRNFGRTFADLTPNDIEN